MPSGTQRLQCRAEPRSPRAPRPLATYDGLTRFPSGNTYDNPPLGLPAGASPDDLGMVFVPEPSAGALWIAGVMALRALRRREGRGKRRGRILARGRYRDQGQHPCEAQRARRVQGTPGVSSGQVRPEQGDDSRLGTANEAYRRCLHRPAKGELSAGAASQRRTFVPTCSSPRHGSLKSRRKPAIQPLTPASGRPCDGGRTASTCQSPEVLHEHELGLPGRHLAVEDREGNPGSVLNSVQTELPKVTLEV